VTSPAFALLGSGEFDPWSASVDRWLVSRPGAPGGDVLIVPTASAAEGDAVFDMWASKGMAHYDGLGIGARVLPLKSRDDASRPELVLELEGAAAVYFSGGNPAYLAGTLAGTPFWDALRAAMERGTAYAGCSAGVACLGDSAPDSANLSFDAGRWHEGLRLFPGFSFGPHWDALDAFVPGLKDLIVSSVPAGTTLVAIDEDTAMMGDGGSWEVAGMGGVHVLADGAWSDHESGSAFDLRLLSR
jgi:cyanophycinase-like exopeptidase